MIVLSGTSWKIPIFELVVGAFTPRDTTVSNFFGSDVNKLALQAVSESLDKPGVVKEFSSGPLTLKTGGVPFFPEARIALLENVSGTYQKPLPLHIGEKKVELSVIHATAALVRESVLAAYLHSVCKIVHMNEVAKRRGVGMTTKMLYQKTQAERERDRLGEMKLVWYDCCESPMVMSSSGISVRIKDMYSPWEPIVTYTDETSSGLGAIVVKESQRIVDFYKRMYPQVSGDVITQAMKDNGVYEWFDQKFLVARIPASINRTVLKPPLLKQLELATVSDATALCHAYLLRTVLRAIEPDKYSVLVNEFVIALKKKKLSVSASELLTGQEIFSWAVKLALGYESDFDLIQVMDGVYRWQEYSRKKNLPDALHPMHWKEVSLSSDGILSGKSVKNEPISIVVPAGMRSFVEMMIANKGAVRGLLSGWEHFVASVYSASFTDSEENKDSYRIKSFRPVFGSIGISSAMMPEDIIGILV